MTRTNRARRAQAAALLSAGLLSLGLLAVLPAAPTASAAVPVVSVKAKNTSTTQVQKVRVKWDGSKKKQTYVKTAAIPGIGDLDLICKPNKQMIRLYTSQRSLETQMWLQKYETKNGRYSVAVKTPRIYRYAHADDNGKGGTGFYTHEGLNQKPGVENRSQDSYMYGVISQRPGRQQSGTALEPLRPVTTFELNWFWNGFNHRKKYQSCTIKAVFTTHFPDSSRSSVTWRGDDDEAPTEITSKVPGIGWLTTTCSHDLDEDPTVSLAPFSTDSSLYIEDVTAEGLVEDHKLTTTLPYDRETDLLGPYPLPENGTLRMRATNGTSATWIMLSSYFVRNDAQRPQRNVCEVASGYYKR